MFIDVSVPPIHKNRMRSTAGGCAPHAQEPCSHIRFYKHSAPLERRNNAAWSSDRIVGRFGLLFQFISVAVAAFDLAEKIQLLVVFKTNADGPRILFDHRLIWRGTVSRERFRSALVHIFPGRVDVSAGILWRSGRVVVQAMG